MRTNRFSYTIGSALLTFIIIVSHPVSSPAQAVVEDWVVTPANSAATQNHWMTSANAGHAIDFISRSASTNNTGKDVVVIMAGEAFDSVIQTLDAATGQRLSGVTMAASGDGFRDHARMATSDDGFICVAGAEGTVQAYTVGGGPPFALVNRSLYDGLNPAVGATCRAFDVTGSLQAGTLRLFVAQGSHVVVLANTLQSIMTFNYVGHFDTGATGDLQGLAESNGMLYAFSAVAPEIRRFQLSYGPFGASGPAILNGYSTRGKSGIALDATGSRAALHLGGSGLGDEFAVTNVVGGANPDVVNIPALASLDRNGNLIYDGGPNRKYANNGGNGGSPDVAIDPVTGDVYGYVPGTVEGAIMKIRVSSSAVSDWNLY